MNFTIAVPFGTVNHGNPQLVCTPPRWYDFMLFYLTNYFAHAFTVVTFPGQGTAETTRAVLHALFLPGAGVSRALSALARHARLYRKDALEQALKAEALCMVVKDMGSFADREFELEQLASASTSANEPDTQTGTYDPADDGQPSNIDLRLVCPKMWFWIY
jgi:hypothetical protein